MSTIQLPRLVGSRQAAGSLLDARGGRFQGASVVVDCSQLRVGTASFADALVLDVVVDGGANELTLLNPPSAFAFLVSQAAVARGVKDRVHGV
jgi:hypothetical protein